MEKKRKVFVSFRFSDGEKLKEEIIDLLKDQELIIDKSERVDRRHLSEESIQEYLFEKLKDSSITIVILTPNAVQYRRNYLNQIDDWLYDELRYSLYNRKGNPINAALALYTKEARPLIMEDARHSCLVCKKDSVVTTIYKIDNLVRDNMMNVRSAYKRHKCDGVYDEDYDSYISLIELEEFKKCPKKYLDIAFEKRENSDNYEIRVIKK